MNKTVNINLGGMFFHIDEDAYQKLTRYFDAIKRSLSNSNGQDEIIKDIEMRIGELITEKHTSDKQVINLKELDEVIAVMGQPEDYRIDSDGDEPKSASFNTNRVSKKLYRDRETGIVGGVLAGLGHYFGIEKVWLRIALLVLVCFYGTGILAYIILWVVMPEAVTTTEKLEMQGEPITISNIEKKVREEFDNVSEKLKNANYDKMGKQVKTGADKFATSIGDVFISVFKIFAKILGAILIVCSLPIIVCLLIGVFTLGSSAFMPFPWQEFIDAGNFSDYPIWSFGLLMFFAVGIPFFFLMILGFKLLITNMKSIGNVAKYTLLAIWLISLGILATIGVRQATEFSFDGKVVQKEVFSLQPTDTLMIKFRRNENYSNDIHHRNFMITLDSTNTSVIYSNDISLDVVWTDEKLPYIQIEKEAKGSSLSNAKKTAEKIKYAYKIEKNKLILDNYLLTDFNNKFRDQQVEITLYLPKGVKFKADESVRDYDASDNNIFNLHSSSDQYTYQMSDHQVKCLDCPSNENEYGDVQNDALKDSTTVTTVKVNGEIIKIETSQKKGLTTDKDGIIIKNN
jgi:phage shock protein PspC (stress-responsive transcriptional regulator)